MVIFFFFRWFIFIIYEQTDRLLFCLFIPPPIYLSFIQKTFFSHVSIVTSLCDFLLSYFYLLLVFI